MSDVEEREFHLAMHRFAKAMTKGSIVLEGTIADVDLDAFTCTITNSFNNSDGTSQNTYYYDVPLKILKASQATFIEIPALGSDCLFAYRDNNIQRCTLVSVDQDDQILVNITGERDGQQFNLNVNGSTLVITKDSIVFNGGDNGGLTIVSNEVTRLNKIESDINDLKTAFKSWVVVASDGGAALKAIAATWYGSSLEKTKNSDIEDTKITH